MTATAQPPRRGYGTVLLAAVIAYVLSQLIFAAVGFRYRLFGDPFDAGKLAIDLGTPAALYFLTLWLLSRSR